MESACKEAERMGVVFVSGERGRVVRLLYGTGEMSLSGAQDVVGAQSADGEAWYADRVILTAGPYADALLDFKGQLRPTAWTLCHIAMKPAELQLYRNLPVMFNVERGFFMEPDEDRHELKICDEHPGYTNFGPLQHEQRRGERGGSGETDTIAAVPSGKEDNAENHHMTSTPFARHAIPLAAANRVRHFLKDTMPHLADRPFSFARICWCADTCDRNFLIDSHPDYSSLVLGVGGSGHGFAHLPSVGGFIVDEMEGVLGARFKEVFRWRPEQAVGRNWRALQGRWGVERRVMDFGEVDEWVEV